jgi:hypothetical protein
MHNVEIEWAYEHLGEAIARAAGRGQVPVEDSDDWDDHGGPLWDEADEPDATIEVVRPIPGRRNNKGGRLSLDPHRKDLMRSLLTTHKGDENQAMLEFVSTVAKESKGRKGEKGLKGYNHAKRVWRRLRPALGDRYAAIQK